MYGKIKEHLQQEIESIKNEAIEAIEGVSDEKQLDPVKNSFIGKKGKLTGILKNLKSLTIEEKKSIGPLANRASKEIAGIFGSKAVIA